MLVELLTVYAAILLAELTVHLCKECWGRYRRIKATDGE